MRKLEIFFDYACPYCLRGHEYLGELLPSYLDIEIIWRPCEAHPRPERYGPHSDLCIQGMFHALSIGADIWDYHSIMFNAALKECADIEDASVLADKVSVLLDRSAFLSAVKSGEYEKSVIDANHYAYEQSGVWAVPAYRMDGKKLDSIENIGVTKKQLADFMRG